MTRKRTVVVILVAGLTLAAAYALASPVYTLDMVDFDNGKELLSVPLHKGEIFSIWYMHSVDVSPVVEVFSLNSEGSIQLEETYFRMFGAGMGHWEGHGTLVKDGSWTKIKDIKEPLKPFILRIGQPGVDHTLLYRDQKINLSARAAGRRVVVSVQHEPRIIRWFQ